jgi:hypothetical protein
MFIRLGGSSINGGWIGDGVWLYRQIVSNQRDRRRDGLGLLPFDVLAQEW